MGLFTFLLLEAFFQDDRANYCVHLIFYTTDYLLLPPWHAEQLLEGLTEGRPLSSSLSAEGTVAPLYTQDKGAWPKSQRHKGSFKVKLQLKMSGTKTNPP